MIRFFWKNKFCVLNLRHDNDIYLFRHDVIKIKYYLNKWTKLFVKEKKLVNWTNILQKRFYWTVFWNAILRILSFFFTVRHFREFINITYRRFYKFCQKYDVWWLFSPLITKRKLLVRSRIFSWLSKYLTTKPNINK